MSNTLDGVTWKLTCRMCPVQIEGEVDGVPFYFRSRFGEWDMGIGKDPVGVSMSVTPGFMRSGEHEHEFEGLQTCLDIVCECVEEWRAEVLAMEAGI